MAILRYGLNLLPILLILDVLPALLAEREDRAVIVDAIGAGRSINLWVW